MKLARYVLWAWCLLMGSLILAKTTQVTRDVATVSAPARNMREARHGNIKNDSGKISAKKLAWQAIESDNYLTYMDNLRATGCPEETVRDIISSDVNKYYELRLRGMHPKEAANKFWEFHSTPGSGGEGEFGKLEMQLNLEKKELLAFLLGPDWDTRGVQVFRDPYEKEFFNTISHEKGDLVRAISDKYAQSRSELYRSGAGFFDEDLKGDLAALASRQRGELAMILSGRELEQWELRYSETARGIRFSSGDFQPTEEEFKVIFQARRMRENGDSALNNSENYLRGGLGAPRYEEYKREQDWDFQNLKKIAGRFGIAPVVTEQVYALKSATESASTEVRSDISLSQEERGMKLQQIKNSTTEKVTAMLGDRAAKAFLRDAGWMRNLR